MLTNLTDYPSDILDMDESCQLYIVRHGRKFPTGKKLSIVCIVGHGRKFQIAYYLTRKKVTNFILLSHSCQMYIIGTWKNY